jgi:hypothetical protein
MGAQEGLHRGMAGNTSWRTRHRPLRGTAQCRHVDGPGQHEALTGRLMPASRIFPQVHHFKWTDSVLARLVRRERAYTSGDWHLTYPDTVDESRRKLKHFEANDGRLDVAASGSRVNDGRNYRSALRRGGRLPVDRGAKRINVLRRQGPGRPRSRRSHSLGLGRRRDAQAVPMWMAPPAGFEPALPPPEGGALSPELRGLKTWQTLPAGAGRRRKRDAVGLERARTGSGGGVWRRRRWSLLEQPVEEARRLDGGALAVPRRDGVDECRVVVLVEASEGDHVAAHILLER